MFNCILFDVDGTLIDTEKAVILSLQKVLKEVLCKEFSEDDLGFVLGIPGAASLSRLGVPSIEEANALWNCYIKQYSCLMRVFPGLESLLVQLKEKGIKTGIVTSKTKEELEADFVPFGLMKYLNYVVCSDDTQFHKPHPEPLLKALHISSTKPEEALYIGDTRYDMECAKGAGVAFGLALWGAKDPGISSDYAFRQASDIVKICYDSFMTTN